MLITLALASCAVIHTPVKKPVLPGTLYKGKYLSIRSPEQTGWYRIKASRNSMQFAHGGTHEDESFGAQVFAFPLPEFGSGKQFIQFLTEGFKKDTPQTRFAIIKMNFRLTTDRKYRCAIGSAVLKDKHALTAPSHYEKLLLESISLYCIHPVDRNSGFAIIYSHRGKMLYPNLKKEAEDFFAGVQVPGY